MQNLPSGTQIRKHQLTWKKGKTIKHQYIEFIYRKSFLKKFNTFHLTFLSCQLKIKLVQRIQQKFCDVNPARFS